MTRDEAVKIWTIPDGQFMEPNDIIDRFVALGMLKLDRPKSTEEKFYDVVVSELSVDSPLMSAPKENKGAVGMALFHALSDAGLKVVEK